MFFLNNSDFSRERGLQADMASVPSSGTPYWGDHDDGIDELRKEVLQNKLE